MKMQNLKTCLWLALSFAPMAAHAETPLERGKYLVIIAGCSDCHTPGGLLGSPDKTKYLGGSDVGFGDPASGVWIGGNLTPDPDTGLGKWTLDQIVASFTKGMTPEGRTLSEIMPWPTFSQLTPEDARAVALYLQSLPPVKNAIPGPYKAGETPAVPYISVTLPTAQYVALPKPK
jgi:mono/diheme cytochrome c family protein